MEMSRHRTHGQRSSPSPVVFVCTSCPAHLPTKRLTNGLVVKKWPDDVCGDCWAVKDIINNPGKHGDFRPSMVRLLQSLHVNDLKLICIGGPSILVDDLVSALYFSDDSTDWVELIYDFMDFLSSVKADNLRLAQRLHHHFGGGTEVYCYD